MAKSTKSPAAKLAYKLNRLAKPGYWVSYIPNNFGYGASVVYIHTDAKCTYVHWDWGKNWCTLLWSCAPTKKKIQKSEEIYEYYATWDDFVKNCTLPVPPAAKASKAPNDV